MKKLLSIAIILLALISLNAFCVSAETPYTYEGLSFSVPDILSNDESWAQNAGYNYAFCDSDTNMELNVTVYENEGYSYAGMDEEALDSYAQSLQESYSGAYGGATVDMERYYLKNGFEGVNVSVNYDDGSKGVFYWFATDELCYDLNFVFYDESYEKYADDIMSTVAIEGAPCVGEVNTEIPDDTTLPDVVTDINDYDTDGYFEGIDLKFEIPEKYGVTADSSYYTAGDGVMVWYNESGNFELDLYKFDNDNEHVYVGYIQKDLDDAVQASKDSFNSLGITLSDCTAENVVVNGFKGIKMKYVYSIYGLTCTEYDYHFSTKDTEYRLEFYLYDEEAVNCHDDIINSLQIEGRAFTGIVVPDGDVENKEYTYEGLTLALPEFLVEDKQWAENNDYISEWIDGDLNFEVILDVVDNTSPKSSYTGYTDEEFKETFKEIKESFDSATDNYTSETIEVNGFEGVKYVVEMTDDDGYPYYETICFFSTYDNVYLVRFISSDEQYDKYTEEAINSIKIEGKPYTDTMAVLVSFGILVFAAVVVAISRIIKKKRAKSSKLPEGYVPLTSDGAPVYFDPSTEAYGVQPMAQQPEAPYAPDKTSCENNSFASAADTVQENAQNLN